MGVPGQLNLSSGQAGLTDSKAADILAMSWCLPRAPQLLRETVCKRNGVGVTSLCVCGTCGPFVPWLLHLSTCLSG